MINKTLSFQVEYVFLSSTIAILRKAKSQRSDRINFQSISVGFIFRVELVFDLLFTFKPNNKG